MGGFVQGIVEMIAPRRGARTSPAPEETDATDEILAIGQEKPVALLTGPGVNLEAVFNMSDEEFTCYNPGYLPEAIDYDKLPDAEQKVTPSRIGPAKDFRTLGIKNEENILSVRKERQKRLVTPEGQAVTGSARSRTR